MKQPRREAIATARPHSLLSDEFRAGVCPPGRYSSVESCGDALAPRKAREAEAESHDGHAEIERPAKMNGHQTLSGAQIERNPR